MCTCSVKSQIGHTKAAAGSAGILKAAAALYHKIIPPMIKVNKPSSVLQMKKHLFSFQISLAPGFLKKAKSVMQQLVHWALVEVTIT